MEDSNITLLIYRSIDNRGMVVKLLRKKKGQPENLYCYNNFCDRLSVEEDIGFRFFFPHVLIYYTQLFGG